MEEKFKTLMVLSHYLEVCLCLGYLTSIILEIETYKYLLLHLQTGRFRQFWDEAAKSRHMVEAVPGEK